MALGSKKGSIRDILWNAISDYNKVVGSHREPRTNFIELISMSMNVTLLTLMIICVVFSKI